MNLDELQNWILSNNGLAYEVGLLARHSAAKTLKLTNLDQELQPYEPDWERLLLAASILSCSSSPLANEAALMVAHAGLINGEKPKVADASAVILTQLANHRAVQLALKKSNLGSPIEERVGTTSQMLLTRRELLQTISPANGKSITTNRFQRTLWDELERAEWVSASAPTASGKTYLVLQWLLNQFSTKKAHLAIFVAPTRALVGEIEHELLEISPSHQIPNLRIASLPIAALGDRSRPTILVFTQERAHIFLNSIGTLPRIDVAIIDEVHKIGDGLRGVILQDAIERIGRSNPQGHFVFLSPLTDNPEALVEDVPTDMASAVVPSEISTVTQNLIIAEQMPRLSDEWQLLLRRQGRSEPLGVLKLHSKPDTDSKRLSFIALALGVTDSGTLVYANGAADSEKIAWQIYDSLQDPGAELDQELKDLADFVKSTIHPKYQLAELVRRGVAFHYGNMPTLLRSEVERLFKEGKIRFLVCTSTLVEGVNLACRTIVIRGPRKGRSTPMGPHDFWNLAGRAGRWGQDFSGNIVCVDVSRPKLWPNGVPERTRYPIIRETDAVLTARQPMIDYLESRIGLETGKINPALEQVVAYLLAWRAREGTFLTAPSAKKLPADYVKILDDKLQNILERIDIPAEIIGHHPGVSAVGLQSLLVYFRNRNKPVEELLPASPESSDAYSRLIAIFQRINAHLFPAFYPSGAVPIHALVTIDWMKGVPLGLIINRRVAYLEQRNRDYNLPVIIRDTMRDVEEIARFRAPKYLAAYLDVLKIYLGEVGQLGLLPSDLRFDLYLEFGVSTVTLLSLIGLGLSRTSAIGINEFIANDQMSEQQVLEWLAVRKWETMDIPAVVKRELDRLLRQRLLVDK